MTKFDPSLSAVLRTGMPVREERFFIRRAIAWATLESSRPFTEKWNDGPIESHPSPSLAEVGMGMTESGGEVWADNPPLRMNEAIKTVTNILVFQFSISCFLRLSSLRQKRYLLPHHVLTDRDHPIHASDYCGVTMQITVIA